MSPCYCDIVDCIEYDVELLQSFGLGKGIDESETNPKCIPNKKQIRKVTQCNVTFMAGSGEKGVSTALWADHSISAGGKLGVSNIITQIAKASVEGNIERSQTKEIDSTGELFSIEEDVGKIMAEKKRTHLK